MGKNKDKNQRLKKIIYVSLFNLVFVFTFGAFQVFAQQQSLKSIKFSTSTQPFTCDSSTGGFYLDGSGNIKICSGGSWRDSIGIGGSGSAGYVPYFGSASSITSSIIFQYNTSTGPYVGIGTTIPNAKLDVYGNINASIYFDRDTSTAYYIDPAANVMPYSAVFAGSVGIGTTNPINKLDVAGAIGFVSNVSWDSSKLGRIYKDGTYGLVMVGVTGVTSDLALVSVNGTRIMENITGTSNVTFGPTGAVNVAIGYANPGTAKLAINGNVGIGTTSPGAPLHVRKDQAGSYTYVIVDNNGTIQSGTGAGFGIAEGGSIKGGLRYERNYSGQFTFFSNANGPWVFIRSDGGGEAVRITNNGNVGIGTTNPGAKLHIQDGNLLVRHSTSAVGIFVDSAAGYESTITLREGSTSKWQIGKSGSNNFFIYNYAAGNAALTILPSGNVGIGTMGPAAKLHIDSGTFEEMLRINTAASNYGVIRIYASGVEKARFGWGTGGYMISGAIEDSFRLNGINGLSLGAGGVTGININTSGNVGIGTTNPTSAGLVVARNVGGVGIDVSNNIIRNVGTPVASSDAATKAYVDTVAAGGNLWAASGSNIYNTNSGNVGIGTTTPVARLDVRGQIASQNWLNIWNTAKVGVLSGGDGRAAITFGATDNVAAWYLGAVDNTNRANTKLGIWSWNGPGWTFVVEPINGNVGIGTTDPATKLEVSGSLRLTSNTGNADIQLHSFTRPTIYPITPNLSLQIRSNGTGVLQLNNDNASTGDTSINAGILYVKASTGNVGIGTTNPRAKLSVHGLRSSTVNTSSAVAKIGGNDVFLYTNAMDSTPWGVWMQVLNDAGASFPLLLNPSGGNIGIGTTSPSTQLHIYHNSSGPIVSLSGLTTNYRGITLRDTNNNEQWFYGADNSNDFVIRKNGNTNYVSINTNNGYMRIGSNTSAYYGILHIAGTTSGGGMAGLYFDPTATGGGTQYGIRIVGNGNGASQYIPLGIYGGSTTTVTASIWVGNESGRRGINIGYNYTDLAPEKGAIIAGNVGIGTTNPGTYKLYVNGPMYVNGPVYIPDTNGSGMADLVVQDKLDVGTIDPIYTIEGKQYSTYMAGMTGVKEETTGVLRLEKNKDNVFAYTIDFTKEKKGSDLWLFGKTTNLEKEGLKNLTVLITPNFAGKIWYEKDEKNLKLIFYAIPEDKNIKNVELSYRLTAPRFDWRDWSNLNENPSMEGFNLDKYNSKK